MSNRKNDLEKERAVEYLEAMDFANKNNLGYIETSAKTGKNVKKVFEMLFEVIHHDLQEA